MAQRTVLSLTAVFVFGFASSLSSSRLIAKDSAQDGTDSDSASEWYYESEQTQPKSSIAQQKAQRRAEQRSDRLASLRWYGYIPGRPQASGMPFTTEYSPQWTRPGGRPFAWYTGYPTVVVPSYHRYW